VLDHKDSKERRHLLQGGSCSSEISVSGDEGQRGLNWGRGKGGMGWGSNTALDESGTWLGGKDLCGRESEFPKKVGFTATPMNFKVSASIVGKR